MGSKRFIPWAAARRMAASAMEPGWARKQRSVVNEDVMYACATEEWRKTSDK
jgi:hypothetical protein